MARPTLCQGNKGFLLPSPPLSRLARPGPLAPAGHLKSDCPWRGGCWLPSGCVGPHLVGAGGLFASVANGLWCEDRDTPLSELEKGWWEAVEAAAGGFYGMGRAGSQSLGSWGLPCRHGLLGALAGQRVKDEVIVAGYVPRDRQHGRHPHTIREMLRERMESWLGTCDLGFASAPSPDTTLSSTAWGRLDTWGGS